MSPSDIISIAVIALIICAAALYIIREKKKGRRCIGCPDSKTCAAGKGCGSCCACQSKKDKE